MRKNVNSPIHVITLIILLISTSISLSGCSGIVNRIINNTNQNTVVDPLNDEQENISREEEVSTVVENTPTEKRDSRKEKRVQKPTPEPTEEIVVETTKNDQDLPQITKEEDDQVKTDQNLELPTRLDGYCPDMYPINYMLDKKMVWAIYQQDEKKPAMEFTAILKPFKVRGIDVYKYSIQSVKLSRYQDELKERLEKFMNVNAGACHDRVFYRIDENNILPLFVEFDKLETLAKSVNEAVNKYNKGCRYNIIKAMDSNISYFQWRNVLEIDCQSGKFYYSQHWGLIKLQARDFYIELMYTEKIS
ncbi:MAG: hypothetical protein NZM04_05430 [Methylacidiphilales bacterium]|nr:hypothetical protein [Candidatus Methylacidiphilales bacterium]